MITISVLFTKNSGDPATGLALGDIDIYLKRRAKSDGSVSAVWDGVNPTEEVGDGYYTRAYTDEDYDTYDYYARAEYTGGVSLDSNHSLQEAPLAIGAADIDIEVDEAIVNASLPTAAEVWSYSRRTLTQAVTSVLSAMEGGDLNIHRGDTFDYTWSNLSVSDVSKAQFTVKRSKDHADAAAILQVDSATGLLYVNGAAPPDDTKGSVTVTSTTIQVVIDADITAGLTAVKGLYWDLQVVRDSGDVNTLLDGEANIIRDVTRATS
jgi:hypothetical protein